MTTTTMTKRCATCAHRKNQLLNAKSAVAALARNLANCDDLRPHQRRGLMTQLERAKTQLANTQESHDMHVFGECEIDD